MARVLPLCGDNFLLYGGDEQALDLSPTGLDLGSTFF
jgi:hypothetical protein